MKSKDSARQPTLPFDPSAAPKPSRSAETEASTETPPPGSAGAPASPESPVPATVDRGPAPRASRPEAPAPGSPGARPVLGGYLPEIVLFLAAIVVLGIGLSAVPLLDPDEARYASASRAMLERNDLVVPYFNGVERINKPALFYWLQAASFHFFGATAAAARIPSAIAALAILVAVTLFARRTFGRGAGWRAGAILLTIPLFAVVGKTGITDMTLALFTVGAMLLWYRLHIGDEGEANRAAGVGPGDPGGAASGSGRRVLWLGISLCLGFAFFVKGPPGILVPCFVIACYLVIRREWSGFRLRGILLGGAVAVAVFLPWVGMLIYRLGAEAAGADAAAGAAGSGPGAAAAAGAGFSPVLFAGISRVFELLRRETIDRTVGGMDHPEPLHYYWVASLILFFPWIAWFPSAIARTWPRLRRLEPATLYLVTWFFGILVFFTAVRGKLATYILPAAPAVALLLAREWGRGADESGSSAASADVEPSSTRWISVGSILLVATMIVLAAYVAIAPPDWLEGHFLLADGLALGLALAASVPLFLRRPAIVCLTVAGVMAATLVAVPLMAGKAVGEKRSLASLAHEAGFSERSWTRVISYKMFRPSLVFYGGRDVTYIDSGRALHEALTPGCLVVLEQRHFDDLPPAWQSALRTVATQGTVLAMTPVSMLPERGDPGDAADTRGASPDDPAR